MIRGEGLKVISTRREQRLQSQRRHMTQNNAQSCDCVFLRHDLIHSCTPLQSLLCIFFITYYGSSLRKTKTSAQHAAVIISHTNRQQALILTILGIKTEGRTPNGTAKVVSLFLVECHAVRTGEVDVQVDAFFSSVLAVAQLVEAPLHNTGPVFYTSCPHFIALGSAQTLTDISVPRNFLRGDMRPARKADNSAVLFVPKD